MVRLTFFPKKHWLLGLFLVSIPLAIFAASYIPPYVKIYDRTFWGCPEKYDEQDTGYWFPEYAPVKKIIIHHTAGSDGQTDGAAVMRGIYQYQAVTQEWGDIGYNYVLDATGKVYEGRYGGDNVIGGHVRSWNTGTIGISVMGNYTTSPVPDEVKNALIDLIALKVEQYGINPLGKSNITSWEGSVENTDNIACHRDYASTDCCGSNLYALLPEIRQAVANTVKIPAVGKLVGKFWSNTQFSGQARCTSYDSAQLSFSKDFSSPCSGVSGSSYSARWDGKADFDRAGFYTFKLLATNRVRLYVDGMLLVDEWAGSYKDETTYSKKIYLTDDQHDIRIDYLKGSKKSYIKLNWSYTGIPQESYTAEYFDNPVLAGYPVAMHDDSSINFNWGTSAPLSDLPNDRFSVQWRGNFYFPKTSWYTFKSEVDDGIMLFVDGQGVINAWSPHGGDAIWGNYYISKGEHEVKVQYYDRSGDAKVKVWWDEGKALLTPTVVPSAAPTEDVGKGAFTVSFYNNPNLEGEPDYIHKYEDINFKWGTGIPHASIHNDNFSARIETKLTVDKNAFYTFTTTTDDGVRLKIDNQVLIDQWHAQAPTSYSASVQLVPGTYTLVMEYMELGGGATCMLDWEKTTEGAFVGEYFANKDLQGQPVLTRASDDLNFDWGLGSPDAAKLGNDNFSVRWKGKIAIEHDGYYQFTASSDDGNRVFIDGKKIIDHWAPQPLTTSEALVYLSKGSYDLVYEYNEWGGKAIAKLRWETVNTTGKFLGEYFDNKDLAGSPQQIRLDEKIDFDWGTSTPFTAIGTNDFSVRWTGGIKITKTANYLFSTTTDDGVKLWIDDALIVDHWAPQPLTTYQKVVRLVPGTYAVKLEYNEWAGAAVAKFNWEEIAGSGYYIGEYFNNTALFGLPAYIEASEEVDFDWGLGSPNEKIPEDNFSVRWTREFTVAKKEEYEFVALTDDGVRLWIDNELLMNFWTPQPAVEHRVIKQLEAGTHTLLLEYYEAAGAAKAQFSFQPKSKLTPTSTVVQPTTVAGEPLMRVGIDSTLNDPITVKGLGQYDIVVADKTVKTVASGQQSSVHYSDGTYSITSKDFTKTATDYVRFVPQQGTILQITSYSDPNWEYGTASYNEETDNYNKFRGVIECRYSDVSHAFWAINELPMEQYLWGMGEALNTHPAEYLKAFSILPRSYALAHLNNGGKRKGEPFILVNTSADQIYKGYNREQFMDKWVAAVNSTRGMVLTYDGKAIITPYFSKSDGRTRTWNEVWPSSNFPWCIGKPDPYGTNEGTPDCVGAGCPNHGVGFSASGARGFIEKEGKTYDWILMYYYTDVEITDLY